MRTPKRTEYNPYSIAECIANTANVSNTYKLTYTDEDNNTQTFCSGTMAADILARFNDRVYLYPVIANRTEEQELADAAAKFAAEYANWWSRRGTEWARLLQAFNKEYDPISNYDRHESGGWSDTNAMGARSGSHNLTDSYATFTDTETVTPTVKTKETVTPTVKSKETVTPTVKSKETVTPTVKSKETVTPGVTETTTETPRVAMETVTTPGVTDTTTENVFADNSSTATPSKSVTVSHTGYDTVTVTPTTGTNSTVVGRVGTNETVNEIVSGNTETVNEIVSGNTETVTEIVSGNTETVNEVVSGNTQTQTVKGAHIDTHNTSTSENAVTDTLTRLFSDYHVYGNIGVTTSAQMLTGELELRSASDIITFALVEFVNLMTIYL